MSRLKVILGLAFFIFVSELAGIIGSVFTMPAIPGWYAGILQSSLTPPAWVFAPVWTTLYALMGVAAFLIWSRSSGRARIVALSIFAAQLVLNTLWSIIFFGWQNSGLAFLEIILLWLAIAWTIFVFARISRPAAYLLLPYILWVSFAAYLNFIIWRLNA